MDYNKRIETILEVYNINASEFAEKIDVPRSSISHILSGRNKPSLDFIMKVKDVYSDLNWDFLILGKLPMFKSNFDKLEIIETSSAENAVIELPFEKDSNIEFSGNDNESEKEKIEHSPIAKNINENDKSLEKIIFFYKDGSFKTYENKD